MARIYSPSDPLVVAVYERRASGATGRFVMGCRRSGKLLKGRKNAPAYVTGRVRPGISPAQLAAEWREHAEARELPWYVRLHCPEERREAAIVTDAQASSRAAARERAAVKAREREALLEERRAQAATALGRFPGGELLLEASEMRVALLAAGTQHACGLHLGACRACGRSADWTRGAVVADRWLCGRCLSSAPAPGLEADRVDGLPMDGRALALALEARPELRAVLAAVQR